MSGGIRRDALLLGFLPWTDPAREIQVTENPAALAAEAASRRLVEAGWQAGFVPVEVSPEGITAAMARVAAWAPPLVLAVGQTRRTARVERMGRVPGAWAPAAEGEPQPWWLVASPEPLIERLNRLLEPRGETEPFTASDDPGGYYCDHLCVELSRDARRRGSRAIFLHVPPIADLAAEVRAARLLQYERQLVAAAEWAHSEWDPSARDPAAEPGI